MEQYRLNELKKTFKDYSEIKITNETKIYKIVVLPTILYGSETKWNKMLRYSVVLL